MPLVRVFSNQGMKERHWEEISTLVGFPIRPDKDLMLNRLIDLNVTEHLARLDEISDSAMKEATIENILNKMQADWDPVLAELKPWKDTGTFIVAGATVDEV
jgi:dynein heavy chain